MENYLYTELIEDYSTIEDSSDTELAEDAVYVSMDMLHLLRRGVPPEFKLLNDLTVSLNIEIDKKTEETRWWGIFEDNCKILAEEGGNITEDDIITPYKLYNILDDGSLIHFNFDELASFYEISEGYELREVSQKLEEHINERFPYSQLSNEELEDKLMDTQASDRELFKENFRRYTHSYTNMKDQFIKEKIWKNFDAPNLDIIFQIITGLIEVIIYSDTPIYKDDVHNINDMCYIKFDIRIEKIFVEAKKWGNIRTEIIARLKDLGVPLAESHKKIDFSNVNLESFSPERLDYIMDHLLMYPDLYKEEINKISKILYK